jgi:hypothetical protein
MTDPFRFIHSSDLHLGKRFGNFDGDLPGRLREARHGVLGRLAAFAREYGAGTILLAGDTFDTETPAPDIRRQALAEMQHHAPVQWVILPGNHDSLQAAQLWEALRADIPDNVTLAIEPKPLAVAPDVVLLPAPCTARRPGRDLTDWFDAAATPDGSLRIGLAHGAIQSFTEESDASDVIAPDRSDRSGLSYLALGDWHGTLSVNARTWYSGTPEPDRFKHNRVGEALLVSLAGATAPPDITHLETGSFNWPTVALDLLPDDDPAAALAALLPDGHARRQSLTRIAASGRTSLAARATLLNAVDSVRPEFAFLDLDDGELMIDFDAADLDRIDRAGALREAADALLAEARDDRKSHDEQEVASNALKRLYAYCHRMDS